MTPDALLEVDELSVTFRAPRGRRGEPRSIRAVDNVSFSLRQGESLGVVGESGSGKSTLARAVSGLVSPTSGQIRFDGRDTRGASPGDLGRDIQMIFQDPFGSVNPRHTVGRIVAEPIRNRERDLSTQEVRARVRQVLGLAQLPPAFAERMPRALSGGQLQRVGIARAIASGPRLLVADEPVSALDVSVQAQILNLLADLRDRAALTCIFIGHNVAVVQHTADRVAVMFAGQIVEIGPANSVIDEPMHPYTRALVAAVPRLEQGPRQRRKEAPVDATRAPIEGCRYVGRCVHATEICSAQAPMLREYRAGHRVACHHADQFVGTPARVGCQEPAIAAPQEQPHPPREDRRS